MDFTNNMKKQNCENIGNIPEAYSSLSEVQTEPLDLSVSSASSRLRKSEITESPFVGNQDTYFRMLLNYGTNIKPKNVEDISMSLKTRSFKSFERWKNWARARNIKFKQFVGHNSVPLDIGLVKTADLDKWLCIFIEENFSGDKHCSVRILKETMMGFQNYLRDHEKRNNFKLFKNKLFRNFNQKFEEKTKEIFEKVNKRKAKLENTMLTLKFIHVEVVSGQFCDSTYPADPDLLFLKLYNERESFDLTRAVLYHCLVTFNLKSENDLVNLRYCHYKFGNEQNRNFVEFVPNQNYYINKCYGGLRVYEKHSSDLSVFKLFIYYINFWTTGNYKTESISGFQRINFDISVVKSFQRELSAVSKKFVASQTSSSLQQLLGTSNSLSKSPCFMISSSWLDPRSYFNKFSVTRSTKCFLTVHLKKQISEEKLVEKSELAENNEARVLTKVSRFKKVKISRPISNQIKTEGPRYITSDEDSDDSD